jgi:hypothetical protein
MERNIRHVVADINGLAPRIPDDLDLDRLQALAEEYFALPEAPVHLDVWFRLYERFPDSDGHGVFWTILHGIEGQPGNEKFVVASVQRNPTHFAVLMVNRLLNGGIASVGDVDLIGLLQSVSVDERYPGSIRQDAEGYLSHQRNRA